MVVNNRSVRKLIDIIENIKSGEWGKDSMDKNYIKCRVLRGTDFLLFQNNEFAKIPFRYIEKNKVNKLKLQPDDILIEISGGSKDQPTGRILFIDKKVLTLKDPIVFSNFVKKLILKKQTVYSKFFYYYWHFLYLRGATKNYETRTTNIRNFDYKNFLNEEKILLPSLKIQQKIVSILDTIQEAINIQNKIIETTKELKKSMMADLFKYGGPSFRKNRKLKKTEIGEIPENWEVVRLGEVCISIKEQVLPKENDIYVGLEHLDSGSIKLNKYGKGSEVKSLKNKFYPGDILYGKLRPYLDKAVITENEGICSTDLIVIRCNETKILSNYLINLIHTSRFLNFSIATMNGTNHPRTSWESLKTFQLPLPPLPEQREIADILQTIDQKIEIEQKKKALYEELFKTMLNKLMSGEIDVEKIEI